MKKRRIAPKDVQSFVQFLREEEKSAATVEKYTHDVRCFAEYIGKNEVDRERVLAYKTHLGESYAPTSANSMIAALNAFLRFLGRQELCVKQFRIQREAYCSEEKELSRAEYMRLLETARRRKNERLWLVLQTICGTGIRVSELQHITVESLHRGEAQVSCKGKKRRVFLVPELRRLLLAYVKSQKRESGAIFVTRSGHPISRHLIWREMKALCAEAGVAPGKVFPHNLRHLFARTFYGIEKDIVRLADVLGHASINTTRIYTVTTGEEHRRQMENMHLIL